MKYYVIFLIMLFSNCTYRVADRSASNKWLAAEDDSSIGFIVRKYLDIGGLLADARVAGLEEE